MSNILYNLALQFLREYSTKVDDLVKDKLEANEEKKSKEQEEKEVVAQSVRFLLLIFNPSSLRSFMSSDKCHFLITEHVRSAAASSATCTSSCWNARYGWRYARNGRRHARIWNATNVRLRHACHEWVLETLVAF